MELSAQLEERGLHLDLAWLPRDANVDADRLADGDYGTFDPELRVGKDLDDVPFLVLHDLLREGLAWHEALLRRRAAAGSSKPLGRPGAAKRPKLREREPW